MRIGIALVLLALVVGGIALGIRALTRRQAEQEGDGQDIIPYGLLAIFVGITVLALAQLGRAAFPGANIIGTAVDRVPAALAGLVVGFPVSFILWRRQAERRKRFPESAGWPLYLAAAEAVLMTALIVVVFQLLDWLILDGPRSSWTDVIVVGVAVGFHQWAASDDRPGSEIAGLPRVVGAAVGLIVGAVGLTGTLIAALDAIYGTIFATAGAAEVGNFVILLALGGILWVVRWLPQWDREPGVPRKTWLVITSVVSLTTAIGAGVTIFAVALTYLLGDTSPAADHFVVMPGAIATGAVAMLIWWHHRSRLGSPWTVAIHDDSTEVRLRDGAVAAYQYFMTAIGLAFGVGALTALAAIAFGSDDFVGGDITEAVIPLAIIALTALGVWWRFWSQVTSGDPAVEAGLISRRIYLLGMAVIAGLTTAQALITTLVVLFQIVLGEEPSRLAFAAEGSLTIFAGAATLHLVQVLRSDRSLHTREDVVTPFQVTVICSHPGSLATMFPKQATTRIVYRADGIGVVDAEMAQQIVDAVGATSSLVWVGDESFEVAPARI